MHNKKNYIWYLTGKHLDDREEEFQDLRNGWLFLCLRQQEMTKPPQKSLMIEIQA